ncbi:MAG: hypothetical protein IBX48_09380 [Thiomicrospira sp.]|uniref:hypothetical protein n=1 Tax=Thiomicrospira sp. TaxID=935 RepID=UPI0019E37EE7|nr:hypothetical protein [Thiomicrospira sp.]MBE0494536.1 hypothetical protein [Thiomicrospira sp.]
MSWLKSRYSWPVNYRLNREGFWLLSTLLAIILITPVSASFAETGVSGASSQQDSRIRLIDYEILLLKTEIALRNSELGVFAQHMQQLETQKTPDQFVDRFDYLQQQMRLMDTTEPQPRVEFSGAVDAQSIVVLLPLSGPYAEAGQTILAPIQQAFANKKVYVIDTELYLDMSELANLVNLFNPDLIIGPLERHKAESFLHNNIHKPVLLFTSIQQSYSHVRSLASSAEVNAAALQPLLASIKPQYVGWLVDDSASSDPFIGQVERQFSQPELFGLNPIEQSFPSLVIEPELLKGGVDKSLARLVGAEQSTARINWLRRTIDRSVESNHYVRQDKSLLVAAVPHQQAIQLAPLMGYYGYNYPIIWVPTQLPDLKIFNLSLSSWQKTYALIPRYFVYEQAVSNKKDEENINIGLFSALAEIAVEMIRRSNQPMPYVINSQIGRIEVKQDGKYYLLPELFELNNGRMKRIAIKNIKP